MKALITEYGGTVMALFAFAIMVFVMTKIFNSYKEFSTALIHVITGVEDTQYK